MINNRVFDALACGTPIISDYFPALKDTFGDMVFYAVKEGDTTAHLENIQAWSPTERQGFASMAKAFIEAYHTYEHRVALFMRVYEILASRRSGTR